MSCSMVFVIINLIFCVCCWYCNQSALSLLQLKPAIILDVGFGKKSAGIFKLQNAYHKVKLGENIVLRKSLVEKKNN